MPQSPHTPISIGKGVDQFQLIVEHAAADQHVHLAGLYPIQQFHDQIRHILWKRSKMQDMPFAVHHAHRSSAKHAGFLDQAPSHNAVGSQQVVHRIGIKFIKPLINLIGIFDFCNIFWGCKNAFSTQNSIHQL